MFNELKGWLCVNANFMLLIYIALIVLIVIVIIWKMKEGMDDRLAGRRMTDPFEVHVDDEELEKIGGETGLQRVMSGIMSSGSSLRQEGSVLSGLGQTIPEHSGGRYSKVYSVSGIGGFDPNNLENDQIEKGIFDTNA